jgi:hypothetical protein
VRFEREEAVTTHFEKINGARVTSVLNVLIETPYFYREDDPDLFAFLRRHKAEFERFYRELYDWELVVDARTARLYKARWHNRALKPSQHDVFDLTRRNDCIGFLLVLEFYERLLEQSNLASDDTASPRFAFGELFEFARGRFDEELETTVPDDETRKILRGLMPTLVRFRFVRELPRDDAAVEDTTDGDHVLYEALPALRHYDVRRLGPGALARALAPEIANEERTP